MKFFSLLSLWLLVLPIMGEEVPRTILVQSERFTLPRTDAYDLLLAGLDDAALRQEMLKRVAAKLAKLDQLVLLRGVGGQAAKCIQAEEFPYVTEYESAAGVGSLVMADASGALALEAMKSLVPFLTPPPEPPPVEDPANKKKEPPPPQGPFRNAGIGLQTTPSPEKLAFRNLGDVLEMEPKFSAGAVEHVTIQFQTESTRYLAEHVYTGIPQPSFQCQQLHPTLKVKFGVPALAGTCSKAVGSGVANGQKEEEVTLQFITAFGEAPVSNPQQPALTEEKIKNKNLRFVFELISLPKPAAHALLENRLKDEPLLSRLKELVQAKSATLETSAEIRSLSGRDDKAEKLTPVSYPVGFGKHLIPQDLVITDQKILDILHLHGGGPTPDPNDLSQAIITVSQPYPAGTVIRNVGESWKVHPVLAVDGDRVLLAVDAEISRQIGERDFVRNRRPVFETRKLQTTISLRKNKPQLLGTMSRPLRTGAPGSNDDDSVALAFVTAFVE